MSHRGYFGGGGGAAPELPPIAIDVREYGSANQLGTALNAAIADLPATGGEIVVPTGSYVGDQPIQYTRNAIHIRGDGQGATSITWPGASIPELFKMSDTTQRYGSIRGLSISSSDVGFGKAINFDYFVNSEFADLRIGMAGAPNKCIFSDHNGSYYNTFRNLRLSAAGVGGVCLGFDTDPVPPAAPGANSNVVMNVRCGGTADVTGVYANALHLLLMHIDVEQTVLYGIDVGPKARAVTIISPYIEGVQNGIRNQSGAIATNVIGGTIMDSTVANIVDPDGTLRYGSYVQYADTRIDRMTRLGIGVATHATIPLAVSATGNTAVVRAETTTGIGTNNQAVFQARGVSATNRAFTAGLAADANGRFIFDMSGLFEWGDGTNPRDTNFYRKGPNQLGTDDAIFIANTTAPPTPTGGGILYVAAGALRYIGSGGTDTQIAAA